LIVSECNQEVARPDPLVFERDDGLFQIGLGDDAPGPFESRRFAQAVAARTAPVLA
jgi:hypothetical protein